MVVRMSTPDRNLVMDGPCQECGISYPPWFADHAIWNYVMSGGTSAREQGGMLCPRCFMLRAEPHYAFRLVWRLTISDRSGGDA